METKKNKNWSERVITKRVSCYYKIWQLLLLQRATNLGQIAADQLLENGVNCDIKRSNLLTKYDSYQKTGIIDLIFYSPDAPQFFFKKT